MNCVVGRNGSGKSNLFDAVQFVLGCPKFWSLRTVSCICIYCLFDVVFKIYCGGLLEGMWYYFCGYGLVHVCINFMVVGWCTYCH